MQPWTTVKSEYLIRDKWLTVRADSCQTPAGVSVSPYYVLEYSDWIHVVAFDSDNNVLITHQYRHAVGKICAEILCGVVEPTESPITAARRELCEETGCTVDQIHQIATVYANPATHTNRIHCFLARGAVIDQLPSPDESEEIDLPLKTVPLIMQEIQPLWLGGGA